MAARRPQTTRQAGSYARSAPVSPITTSRNLVLCFDGTSNSFGSTITNVPLLFGLLSANPSRQMCYYQSGIGTNEPLLSLNGIMTVLPRLVDEAIAYTMADHVVNGYAFLMEHYRPGDRIFLFGFSRGAFTARALAGMLQVIGLLFPGNSRSLSLAYNIYAGRAEEAFGDRTLAEGFQATFCRAVGVHYIGVWDTVASVGAIVPRTLPFASSAAHITFFRQALSLDERRARFFPMLWTGLRSTDGGTTDVKEVWFAGAHCDVGGGSYASDGDVLPRTSHCSLIWMVREAFEAGLHLDNDAVQTSRIYAPYLSAATQQLAEVDQKLAGPLMDEIDPVTVALVHLASHPPTQFPVTIDSVKTEFGSEELRATYFGNALAPRSDSLDVFVQAKLAEFTGQPSWTSLGSVTEGWVGRMALTAVWWMIEITPGLKIYWDDDAIHSRGWMLRANFGRGRLLCRDPVFHTSVLIRQHADKFALGEGCPVPETSYVPRARFWPGQGERDVTYVE